MKSFGAVEIVRDFNFDVKDHEFVVFLGPSGCGKSTILRMIAGLEEISGGTLSIGDRVVNDLLPRDRNVAMVFQNYALYPHMTVFDNIAFGLKRMKIASGEIASRVKSVAEVLGLDPFLSRKPAQLSGGQQQRVAIARAIIKTPQVFLFDEPLSNLDAKLRNHMRVEIARLHKKLQTTTIYVTHDQLEAMTLADRIVILNGGKIEQVGTPAEIYDRPRSLFVAGFIGTPSMNLIDVTVGEADGRWLLSMESGSFSIGRPRFDLQVGQKAVLGIRPADLKLVDGTLVDGTTTANVIDGIAEFVEFLGNEALVDIAREGFADSDRGISALVATDDRPAAGVAVRVTFDERRIHLFDASSGLSLLRDQCQGGTALPVLPAEDRSMAG
jgi:multiple sugar transport system ATP-binding protein